jgi:hypothetical protein
MDGTADRTSDVERSLLGALTRWAAGSAGVGGALWWAGAHCDNAALRAFGRQTAAWGAVNGAIAAVGWARRHSGAQPTRGADLRRLLTVNAGLDVGYVLGGIWLIAARDRLDRRPRYSADQATGDGAAVIVQGTFLLVLDATHARRLNNQE